MVKAGGFSETELPPFAAGLIESGEALAYLHLTGSHAAMAAAKLDADVGSVHTYETSMPSDPETKISFDYEVLAIFNGDRGDLGQAVAYQPQHAPDRVVVAFRAVRVGQIDALTSQTSGNRQDVESYLDPCFIKTTWLPSRARMSRGLCRHAGAVWALGSTGGLGNFLVSQCAGKAVHFVGLSLAGALAQATALRATIETKETKIDERAHVITFGALPWANAGAAECYSKILGARSVHLASRLSERVEAADARSGQPAVMAPCWWDERRDVADAGGERMYDVLDPLTNAFVNEHTVLPNTYAIDALECRADADVVDVSEAASVSESLGLPSHAWTSGAHLTALTTFPEAIVPRQRLQALMSQMLEDDDALVLDYMRLHRGRAYKAALKALVDSTRAAKKRRAREAEEEPPAAAKLRPGLRRNTSKRTLDEALLDPNNENVADGSNTAIAERPPTGRLSKVASYGSLADKLDQIGMF